MYYNHLLSRPLDVELDGCELAQWRERYGRAAFARHPLGFKIFLSPDQIDASDEYADADPYAVAKNFDSAFQRRRVELTLALVQEAAAGVEHRLRVADLGCGEGHITAQVGQAVKDVELAGLDYSISAISYAHEHFPEIDFCVADVYEPPYLEGYFDIAVINNLWEHVPDPLRLLDGVKRILRPGGHVIVSTPSRYHVENLLRALRGKPIEFMSSHHVTEYTVGQVLEQMRFGGFQVEKVRSKPIPMRTVAGKVIRSFGKAWCAWSGSRHQLEETVFYLAKKN